MIPYLINNQPYIDLEPYIDFDKFVNIEKDIILGIVKSKELIMDDGCSFDNQLDKTYPSIVNASLQDRLKNPDGAFYKQFEELNFNPKACKMFMRYASKYSQMGQLLSLRSWTTPGAIHHKSSAEHCVDLPAAENFPSLMEWVYSLPIFDGVGRVVFFFNAPGEPHTVHKDTYLGTPDNFLLINLHPDRKDLFLVGTTGEKYVIPAKAFVFDPRNYHGTVGKDFYSWTLRIDGKFNKDWLVQQNLLEYYS